MYRQACMGKYIWNIVFIDKCTDRKVETSKF